MSTIIQPLFHETYKEQFLETMNYSKSTKRVVRILFQHVSDIETKCNKDVSSFTKEEFELLWNELNATSFRSLQNRINVVEKYCLFLNEQIQTKKNHCFRRYFEKREDVFRYVSKNKILFYADEMYNMAFTTENAQDGVLLILLFHGLSFKEQFKEFVELGMDQITDEGIQLHNRFLPLSFEQIQLVQKANDQMIYQNSFGNTSRQYKLPTSSFVLKGLRGKKQITPALIQQRMIRLSKKYGLDHLNATNVSYSGQFELAKNIIEKGETLDQALMSIVQRFDTIHNESSLFALKTKLKKDLYEMSIEC